MLVPQLLLETLEDLREGDFETVKWYLSMDILEGCKRIPVASLEDASRTKTVREMIKRYSEELAVKVTVEILRKMENNHAAGELEKRYTEGKTAKPSTSSSAVAPPAAPVAPPAAPVAPPAAPATMTAQNGAVIIAPTITGGTSGTLNITVNK